MDEAKQKRTNEKRRFTRKETQMIELINNKDTPMRTLERELEEFRAYWRSIQDAHDDYIGVAADGDTTEEENYIREISSRFTKLEVQIDSIIEDIEKAQWVRQKTEKANTGQTIDSSKNTPNNSIQLERMKVQKYDGDIRKYPKFKEEFMLYVKPLCQASQLSFVLKSHLLEEVKEDLDNVNDEFDILWERLDAKYGDGKNTLHWLKL
jgi:hypothetical protein